MSTPKQIMTKLLVNRPAFQNRAQGPSEVRKVVYLHLAKEIVALRDEYQNEANLLRQAMGDAHAAPDEGLAPDGAQHDTSACSVSFTSKSAAKKAAQFLADVDGFSRGNHMGTESIVDYQLHDKTIRCQLDHVCSLFDPNGFMDFDFAGHQVGDVIAIDRSLHQLAKRYLGAFSPIQQQGIVPDWTYSKGDCDRIWKTYQLIVKLTRLIVSSCQSKKPRPEITAPSYIITFQDDEESVDILVDGKAPQKFTSAAKRAVMALALQPDLTVINTKTFCNECDPVWAKRKAGTKNVAKKFTQAMKSLRGVIPELHDELLSNGNARVAGLELKKKPADAKLRQQIRFLLKPQSD